MAANAQLHNAPAALESLPRPVQDTAKLSEVNSQGIDPLIEEPKWFEAARELRLNRQGSGQSDLPTAPVTSPRSQASAPSDSPPADLAGPMELKTEPAEILNPKIGVAFSGGGVRSATFNLGVLQALASHGVLDRVGYISSVSGGSYINAWLASWISKCGFDEVTKALADHDPKGVQTGKNTTQHKTESRNVVKAGNGQIESHHKKTQSNAEQRYNQQRPISHLRHYSSYLTPHSGLLSSDVWAAVAAYCLRLAPNLLFVLLGAFTLICVPYLLAGAYRFNAYPSTIVKIGSTVSVSLAQAAKGANSIYSYKQEAFRGAYTLNSYLAFTWAMALCLLGLGTLYFAKGTSGYDPRNATESRKAASRHAIVTFTTMLLVGPLLAMAGVYTSTLYDRYKHPITDGSFYVKVLVLVVVFVALAYLSAFLFSLRIGLIARAKNKRSVTQDPDEGTTEAQVKGTKGDSRSTLSKPTTQNALFPTAAIGCLLFALVALGFSLCFRLTDQALASALATVFAPSLLLLAYVGMASVGVALLPYDSGSQEWLNRIWGDSAILTLGWTAIAAITLLWPQFVGFVRQTLQGERSALLLSGVSITGGWILTTISGVLSAFSSKTSGPPTVDSDPTPWRIRTKQDGSGHWLENLLARIAPYVFVVGLLLLMSSFVQMVKLPLLEWLLVPLGFFLTVFVGKRIDVNRLSLHNFYRFRLIECYLAASRRGDAGSLTLAELSPDLYKINREPGEPHPIAGRVNPFDGPFPIINCTLNVTKGDSLDLQKRRARNFIFSPVACGFTRFKDTEVVPSESASETLDESGVVPLEKTAPALEPLKKLREYAMISSGDCGSVSATPLSLASATSAQRPKSIPLGAAMAISGAAQSPNQGSHTSPPVAALLTLANIRLGWWLGNPRDEATYKQDGPDNGLRPMLDELLAQATDEKAYVYLSDGGHFENLGLYELIRRRCKLIILCDADCDPSYKFDDLVNAIELCQVDFGATITLDTDPLQNTLKAGWCRTAFTVGTIEYSDIDGAADTGTIIYLKSAVTRQNSIVVHSYDRYSKHFPHEPTTNQWFDETQFEAYRLLGLETANAALDAVSPRFPLQARNGSSNSNARPGNAPSTDSRGPQFPPPPWWNKPQQAWRERAEQAQRMLWSEDELKEKGRIARGSPNSNNGGGNA